MDRTQRWQDGDNDTFSCEKNTNWEGAFRGPG